MYSERMYHDMLGLLKQFSFQHPHKIVLKAIIKLLPLIALIPIKLGSSVYNVPVSVGIYKKRLHAIKWIIKSIKKSESNVNVYGLAEIIYGAFRGEGAAIEEKKKLYLSGVDNSPYMRFLRRL